MVVVTLLLGHQRRGRVDDGLLQLVALVVVVVVLDGLRHLRAGGRGGELVLQAAVVLLRVRVSVSVGVRISVRAAWQTGGAAPRRHCAA